MLLLSEVCVYSLFLSFPRSLHPVPPIIFTPSLSFPFTSIFSYSLSSTFHPSLLPSFTPSITVSLPPPTYLPTLSLSLSSLPASPFLTSTRHAAHVAVIVVSLPVNPQLKQPFERSHACPHVRALLRSFTLR